MKLITLDKSLASVLLFGKFIVRVKKGVYDIALISYINENEFKEIILVDVSRFAVEKETYISTIYIISHPCPDIILGDDSLERNYQGVSYGLDYTIINDLDSEDTEKTESLSDSEE